MIEHPAVQTELVGDGVERQDQPEVPDEPLPRSEDAVPQRRVQPVGAHDQVEALTLSDRIAVMSAGRIEQIGTPAELYDRPATPFVRDFLGQTVAIRGQVLRPESVVVELERDDVITANGGVRATIEALLFAGERYEARLALAEGVAAKRTVLQKPFGLADLSAVIDRAFAAAG